MFPREAWEQIKTDNPFYNSYEFKKIVSESIADYHSGNIEDMDKL